MSELFRLPPRGSAAYRQLVRRRPVTDDIQDQVSGILGAVRDGGDRALLDLTERYDGVRLTTSRVESDAWQLALDGLDGSVRKALAETIRRVELVHRAQQFHEGAVSVAPGVQVWREWRAVLCSPPQRDGQVACWPASRRCRGMRARCDCDLNPEAKHRQRR